MAIVIPKIAGAEPGSRILLLKSTSDISHTGDTDQTDILSVTVPGGLMQTDSAILVEAMWYLDDGAGGAAANTGTAIIRWDNNNMYTNTTITAATENILSKTILFNDGALNSQKSSNPNAPINSIYTNKYSSWSEDTTGDIDITFRVAVANAGDAMHLIFALVELIV